MPHQVTNELPHSELDSFSEVRNVFDTRDKVICCCFSPLNPLFYHVHLVTLLWDVYHSTFNSDSNKATLQEVYIHTNCFCFTAYTLDH